MNLNHKTRDVFVRNTMQPTAQLWSHFFYLWPWMMTLTLTFHHSKCAAPWDTHACQISSCYLQYCKSTHKMSDFGHIYLTSDLEGWPWPSPFTTQNVQLHEIHMHAKYQVPIFNIAKELIKWAILATYIWHLTLKDDLDLDLSPLKLCSSMRYTCMPNIKLLSWILKYCKSVH